MSFCKVVGHLVAARSMIRGAAIPVAVGLALSSCAYLPGTAADEAPANPVITQAQATEVVKNYSVVNNKANRKHDARLLSTVENGDLFAGSAAGYTMLDRLGAKNKYTPFTYIKPVAYAPPAGAYPQAFVVYSGNSADPRQNALSVFRRFDAATPWKRVVSGFSESKLPAIQVGETGMATMTAPTASGYAVAPIDVAPALAKAMAGATLPAGVTFATSPIVTRYNEAQSADRVAVKGKGTSARVFTPTEEIYTIKTQDGGVLVMGGMNWRQAESYTDGWQSIPKKGDEIYPLYPDPITSFKSDHKAMWAVQVPVTGPLKLVSWMSTWADYDAS